MTERQNGIIQKLIALISSLALGLSALVGWNVKHQSTLTESLIQRVAVVETRQQYPPEPPQWFKDRIDKLELKIDKLEAKIDTK